jgi:Tol biopolymer transport system component
MTRRLMIGLVIAAGAVVAALGGSVHAAKAAYPGTLNGRIAFGMTAADGNSDIFTVRPNGTGLRRLTFGPQDVCAAVSANGRKIAFCRGSDTDAQIWTMNFNGTAQHQVSPTGATLIFPDFSPNGRKIVASGVLDSSAPKDQIYVMDSHTGGHLHALTTAAQGNSDFAAWSPNGKKIAFISDRTGIEQVWVMNADGSCQHQLTSALVTHDEVPDWSPDGKQIVFEVGDVGSGTIWVMNANGSHQHQISSGPGDEFGPEWSPRGNKIAFVADYGNGNRPIETMNPDGSDLQILTPGRNSFVPAWQPLH